MFTNFVVKFHKIKMLFSDPDQRAPIGSGYELFEIIAIIN